MAYTAVGQTVHLAARMEQMAQPGSILISAEGLRLAEGHVKAKSVGHVAITGMSTPWRSGGSPLPPGMVVAVELEMRPLVALSSRARRIASPDGKAARSRWST
jgi:hypothetical protein